MSTWEVPKCFTSAGQHSLLCAYRGVSSCEEPQPGCCWTHVHIQDRHSWNAISWVTAFKTTSSLQSPDSETSTPARARVVRYSSQKAESSCPLLLGVKKYRILKPTFTDSLLRCWTSAISPENEGCRSLSTYLKNSNIHLLLNNYMTIQKFLIIRSRA